MHCTLYTVHHRSYLAFNNFQGADTIGNIKQGVQLVIESIFTFLTLDPIRLVEHTSDLGSDLRSRVFDVSQLPGCIMFHS